MRFSSTSTDDAALAELGRRLARLRIARDLTQDELAREAGVARRTIVNLERGQAVQLPVLLRVLRALGELERLELLVPEPVANPLDLVARAGAERRRVRHSRRPDTGAEPGWSWGDTGPAT